MATEPTHLLTDSGAACGSTEEMWTSPDELAVSCPVCRLVVELRTRLGGEADRRLVQTIARRLANVPV